MRSHPVEIPPLSYDKPKPRHYLEYFLFRSFSFILEHLPLDCSFALTHRLADLARVILKKKSRETQTMISKRLGLSENEAAAILQKSFHNFAENWVHLCRDHHKVKNIPAFDENVLALFKKAQKEQRGIVFATGHFAWWELMPKILYKHQIPFAVTVAVQHNPLFDNYVNRRRTCDNYHAILHNRLGIRHTFEYLKKGGFLVILADVDVREKGLPVPFLDQMASTPKWPAELAIRTDAFLCNTRLKLKDNGDACIQSCKPIDPRDYQNRDTAVMEMLQKMNDHFSDFIRETPEQWFWLQRRWKTSYPDAD
jgi:lauroyl/myristoyl acyltransferase